MRPRTPSLVLGPLLMLALLLVAAAPAASAKASPAAGAAATPLLIPAYFAPGAAWRELDTAPRGSIVIANPDNGPGTGTSGPLRAAIDAARSAGLRPVGYVHTSGGTRAVGVVERDVDRWRTLYGVSDIFFDEVASGGRELSYYRTVTRYARSHGARLVVINPGDVPARGYFPLANVVVDFEDTAAHYLTAHFPSWLGAVSPAHVAQIVIGAPPAQEPQVSALTRSRGAGYRYITDEQLPNPYAGLPSYFATEALGSS